MLKSFSPTEIASRELPSGSHPPALQEMGRRPKTFFRDVVFERPIPRTRQLYENESQREGPAAKSPHQCEAAGALHQTNGRRHQG